ncbi:MAG: hypothetical protein JSV25_16775 [Spirochaetota bacterium]|nr:MAG: hypothetical protein JSV25_16775 [Spirochaetota bacterium]
MESIAEVDHNEIEKRKETISRMWEYKKIDHIPIGVWIDDFSQYTLREQCEDGLKQFETMVNCANRCLRNLPDDYIPYVRIWPGYMTIATMFGMEIYWSDDPNQAPGTKGHIIEVMDDVYNLKMPDAKKDGLMPHNLKWLSYADKNLPKDVYIAGIDLGGPLNTAKDLLETNLLYTSFLDSPDAMHYLLKLVAELQRKCNEEIIRAVDGLQRLTCTDFDPIWAPLPYKGFVSDDVCSALSPDIFKIFSIPYNNMIFDGFDGGRLHNCGPNPSANLYHRHDIKRFGLNCSYKYSKDDIQVLKSVFSGKGIIEFNFDNGESADEILKGFEEIANVLSPDVIGMPVLFLNESWRDEDLRSIYADLRKISDDYAGAIEWTCE